VAQACVVGNTLWLFGGTIEVGDREITLDDMWSLDLSKLDGCVLWHTNSVSISSKHHTAADDRCCHLTCHATILPVALHV
jgi:hypothetical protein